MLLTVLLVSVVIVFIVLYTEYRSSNALTASSKTDARSSLSLLRQPGVHVYVFLFHVDNVDLINLQLKYLSSAMKEPYKAVVIMDTENTSLMDVIPNGFCVKNNTQKSPSRRHGFSLNWCTSTFIQSVHFEDDDICMYIDGDLFFITDIYPSKIMDTNIRYLAQSREHEYPWPGYLWFKPAKIELDLLDLSCAPRGDTGSNGWHLLANTESKRGVTIWYHTEYTTLENKDVEARVRRHWQLVREDVMMEIGDNERYIHIRGLTSNWIKSPIAKDRYEIFV